jgi:hypothetical protein
MKKVITLRDAIIRAWDNTQPCPDGVEGGFCPSCLYASLQELLEFHAEQGQAIDG